MTAASFNKKKVLMTSFVTVISIMGFPSISAQSNDDQHPRNTLRNNNKNPSHHNLEDLVPDNLKTSSSNLKAFFESGTPHQACQ